MSDPGLPPPLPQRRRRSRWKLAFLTLVGLLLLLIASGIGTGWYMLRSEGGVSWLLAQIPGLRIEGLRGRPDGGPLEAARVEWQGRGTRLVIDGLAWRDVAWRWRPYPGAWLGIEVMEPNARRVELVTGPGSGEKPKPPQHLRLPVELVLQGLSVDTLQVNKLPPLTELRAQAHLGADLGRRHRIARLSVRSNQATLRASGAIGTGDAFLLELQADLASLPDAAQAWAAQLRSRGPLVRVQLEGTLRAPAKASLDLRATLTPFAAWPLAALEAHTSELDLAALASGWPSTRLSGRAVVQSSGLDAPAAVELELTNARPGRWDEARLPVSALKLALRGKPNERDRLEIAAFDATLASARAAGHWSGSGRWERDRLTLDSRIDALQPALLDRRLAPMTLGGELTSQLEGRVDARRPPIVLDTELAFDAPPDALAIELKRFAARAGASRANASASLRRDAARQWNVKSRGELVAFDPSAWWPGIEGSAWRRGPHAINARWDADLTQAPGARAPGAWLRALRGQADLRLANSRLAGVPLEAMVVLRATAGATQLDGTLQAATNRATVTGRAGGDTDRWTLDLQAPALAALAPWGGFSKAAQAWMPQAGTARAQAVFEGRWPALKTEGELHVLDLKTGDWRAARADARWTLAGARADAPLSLTLVAEGLAHHEQRIERAQAELAGSLASHRLVLDATSPLRPPAWTDGIVGGGGNASAGSALRAELSGTWVSARDGSGTWRGTLAELRVASRAPNAAPWIATRQLQAQVQLDPHGRARAASAAPGRIELLGAALRWSQASWQPGGVQLDAELEPLRIAPWLAKLQPHFGWGGDLTVNGRFKVASGERFAADLVLERASGDLAVTDETGTQALGLTDLRLGLLANEGTWHFTQALAGSNVGVLGGAQSLRVSPQTMWPPPQTPLEGVLEMRVANLGVWAPWLPPGWRLGGQLRTSASLGGRFGAPEYTGQVVGSGLSVRNLLQGVDVRDGDLALSLRGADAKVERFRFRGGDGELRLEGGANFGAEPRADLRLVAQHFQLLGRVDRRIVASGDATLALQAQQIKLDGRFTVDEGLVDVSRADAPTLDSDVIVARRDRPAPVSPDAAAPPAENKLMRNATVALEVQLGEQLRLRGRGLDTLLRGRLRVSTPGGRIAINGAVRAESGTYVAYGQKLVIERGVIFFAGEAANPRLDIVAVRPNLDVRVGVAVAGSTLSPRVRLFSEPEMSELDKLSWLVMGRASEGLGRTDTALLQRAAIALLSGSEGGEAALIKNIGLDELSLRQTQTGDVRDTVISVGKQLSSRWYVGYERGVNATTGTWQLIYRIAQRFTLRAQSGEENSVDLIWTWRW
jgi:translocation and assembly module TamB